MKSKVTILKVDMCVCACLCVWWLYAQVRVNRFAPGWRSDPGPPPVTPWMIAVTETCLIPALMLGFWWPPHFDAAARLNPTTPCDTHTHTPSAKSHHQTLYLNRRCDFLLLPLIRSIDIFLKVCSHPLMPCEEGSATELQPSNLRHIIFYRVTIF